MARLEKILKKETRVVRFVMVEATKKIRRDCGDHIINLEMVFCEFWMSWRVS